MTDTASMALTLAVALPLYNRAHEDLDGTDVSERDLALKIELVLMHAKRRHTYLARRLPETEVVTELLLANGARCIDLVAENEERHLGQLLDGEQCVELSL